MLLSLLLGTVYDDEDDEEEDEEEDEEQDEDEDDDEDDDNDTSLIGKSSKTVGILSSTTWATKICALITLIIKRDVESPSLFMRVSALPLESQHLRKWVFDR